MRKTKSKTTKPEILNERLLVSDEELAVLLGCGLPTARKIANESNAVCRFGKLKRNNVAIIKKYLSDISGED